MKNLFHLLLVLSMLTGWLAGAPVASAQGGTSLPLPLPNSAIAQAKIDPALRASLAGMAPNAQTTVIVTLQEQAGLVSSAAATDRVVAQQATVSSLRATAATAQAAVQPLLAQRYAEGAISAVTPFWVFNGFSVTATPAVIAELAARPDVAAIAPDAIDIVPAAIDVTAQPNLTIVNAPPLWDAGWAGQGVVVASLDTGVDITHPDLAARWRGGSNSWFDAFGQHPAAPFDADGHGTWTMGVMVGGSAGGSAIGMAPEARWIAARIFNDQRESTVTAIHSAFQWLLDPDGNPKTADAPHVVNNSWTMQTPGCNLTFELDLQALRAAGILPIFAAGNSGPAAGTSMSPANNPSAFAVGGTSNSDQIYTNSSRGPAACGEPSTIFPDVTAPGIGIMSSDRGGGYTYASGTSLAAPHVAGGLAALLSAFPNLSVAQQEAALHSGVIDLGVVGPDNDFGAGRLNLQAAYQWLVASGIAPQTGSAIVVDTTADVLADDAFCSLREAILSANSDSAVGGCTAGGGGDTITFDPALPRPSIFTLARAGAGEDGAMAGDLDIAGTLTIDGMGGVVGASWTGSDIVIDGGALDRVFDVQAGAHVALLGVTVRNGLTSLADDGGGIRTRGELVMRNAAITGNQGGGLRNEGGSAILSTVDVISNTNGYGVVNTGQATLDFTDGRLNQNQGGGLHNVLSTATLFGITVQGNGGSGVHNEGATLSHVTLNASAVLSNTAVSGGGLLSQGVGAVASVSDSRFAYNTAVSGGGIFNNGSMTVAGSTVDHNQATAGGGIHHFGGSLALTNNTISQNNATDNGGGLYNRASTTAVFVTFDQNSAAGAGGNLFNDEASIALGSTILAGAAAGGNCANSAGQINSTGYNVESAATCALGGAGDLANTDPLLGLLKDNSGPTPTHALRIDSPAIDRTPSGTNGCAVQVKVDQRGITRPVNASCDAGAYEATTSLGDITPIHTIQGAGHRSPLVGSTVTTRGIVTALGPNGFYLQYAKPDGDSATAEGIFVANGGSLKVLAGDDVLVLGTVAEIAPGGALSHDLTVTTLTNAGVTLISTKNTLPAPVVLGQNGRTLPTAVIEDDALTSFDPASDGLDFYESLEGMRVQVNDAIVVGPSTADGDFWVLADSAANAGPRTDRGGVYAQADDANPERIRVSGELRYDTANMPAVTAGATFGSPLVGIMDYDRASYALRTTQALSVVVTTQLAPEVTPLTGDALYQSIATLDAGNLGGSAGDGEYAKKAALIVQNLRSPDIVVLDEVGDNNGAVDDGIVAADVTFGRLIAAVQQAGGPTYAYAQIDPFDAEDGGELGSNARLGLLYNPQRVQMVNRPGDAGTDNSVSCTAGQASLALNPGRIGANAGDFLDGRKPLAAQFSVAGERLFVITVHFDGKENDTPEFGAEQPVSAYSATRRQAQAQLVHDFVAQILGCEPEAKVIVAGNPNDDLYTGAVAALEGASLFPLMDLLPANARFSSVRAGNSRVTTQMLVSSALWTNAPRFDVVHAQAEFAGTAVYDDPVVAKVALTRVPQGNLYLPLVSRVGP